MKKKRFFLIKYGSTRSNFLNVRMLNIEHEGLLFSKEYILPTEIGDEQNVNVRMKVRLPLLLSPLTWKRYDLSLIDIKQTLEEFEVRYILMMAILHDISIPMSACSASNLKSRTMFNGKTATLNKLIRYMLAYYTIVPNKVSNVLFEHKNIRPALPTVRLDVKIFQEFRRNHRYLWRYKDVTLGLMNEHDEFLYLVRVIPADLKHILDQITEGTYLSDRVAKGSDPHHPIGSYYLSDEIIIAFAN